MDLLKLVRLSVTYLYELKTCYFRKISSLYKHLLQNPTLRLDFNKPTILGSENDTATLSILESLFIQEQTPDLNNDSLSRSLMIFNA